MQVVPCDHGGIHEQASSLRALLACQQTCMARSRKRTSHSPTGGNYRFGHFNVMQILSWEDIVDQNGKVLVTEFDSSDPKHMHVVAYLR